MLVAIGAMAGLGPGLVWAKGSGTTGSTRRDQAAPATDQEQTTDTTGDNGQGDNAGEQDADNQDADNQDDGQAADTTTTDTTAPADEQDDGNGNADQQQQNAQEEQDPPANNCTLKVPDDPLSAEGLATPYELGDCDETNPDQGAFVEATILDPATGALSVYHPLIISEGTEPLADPVAPTLPAGAVVGLNFGFQGDTLTLENSDGLTAGNCVTGLGDSAFGQVSFCNNVAFYAKANQLIAAGTLKVPDAGTGRDGEPCPTLWTYNVADADMADNVVTTYLSDDGRTAQDTAANRAEFGAGGLLKNGSDSGLQARNIDPALGCDATLMTAPDVTDPANPGTATTMHLESLQAAAAAGQHPSSAFVPIGDPMVLDDGEQSLEKLNLYRASVNQPAATEADTTGTGNASDTKFCRGLLGPEGIVDVNEDKAFYSGKPSPTADADDLFHFLMFRFNDNSYSLLNCADVLGLDSPVKTETEDGVVVDATLEDFTLPAPGQTPGNTEPPATENTEPPATENTDPPAAQPEDTTPPDTAKPRNEDAEDAQDDGAEDAQDAQDDAPPVTEPPATEPPVTESPVTEAPDTEPPATEATLGAEQPRPQLQAEAVVDTGNDIAAPAPVAIPAVAQAPAAAPVTRSPAALPFTGPGGLQRGVLLVLALLIIGAGFVRTGRRPEGRRVKR
jgi:hypothetical protein